MLSPRPQRILFADHTAKLGGGEIALLNLVRHLDRDRYIPVVLLFSEGPLCDRLRESSVETCVVPLSSSVVNARKDGLGAKSLLRGSDVCRSMKFVLALRREIRRLDVDLVHTNSLKADILAGLAARFAGIPLVWHVRDRIADDYLPSPVARLFRWLARFLPNFVIANSHATLKTLQVGTRGQAIYSGTTSFDARIIHDGIGVSKKPDATLSAASSRPLQAQIGLIGRIAPWKGQHVFLQAAARLRRRFPQCQFQVVGSVLFGEKEYEREIHELAQQLGLDDCVEFTGFREDIPDLIANMDILVHASTTGEPFGQVIIEAMAAGKPIVATNGGGVPEIVDDGINGLLVPMGDADAMAVAIERLLEDPELRARMGAAGLARVEQHFTIQLTAARVQAVYDHLLFPQTKNRGSLSPTPHLSPQPLSL